MSEKRWVTKHALTQGIKHVNGRRFATNELYFKGTDGTSYGPKDHHATKGDAIVRAEQMRDSRIKALQKQIEKLQAMEFYK